MTGLARSMMVAVAVGAFLTLSGAFGVGGMSLPARLAYWIVLLSAGTAWGVWVARRVFKLDPRGRHVWLQTLGCALFIAGPFTGVVWLINRLALGAWLDLPDALSLFVVVALISLALTTINVLVERGQAPIVVAGAAPPPPPRFLDRLPLKLRGADVWAVESEDHYLRLHTSRGQDLILMRLADAIAELEGVEGAQVHRSWWVARSAIADARRADGRATLTLKDGAEVPVSRTYAKALRDRNWI